MSLKNYIWSLAFVASILPSKVSGQTIFNGMRGPTNFQLDERVSFSNNEKDVNSSTNTLILKYWDGDKFGKWGFVSIPYKFIDSPDGSNNGLGDISVSLGPRGRIKNLNLISYLALTFPSGETKNIPIGNGRLDKKVGVATTYLSNNKDAELTFLLEYNSTGSNNNGINLPNEISVGGLISYKIRRLRIATGLVDLVKENGGFLLNFRNGIRYTLSPKLHFEFYGDLSIKNRVISRNKSISTFFRYNF